MVRKIYEYLFFKTYMLGYNGSSPEIAHIGATIAMSMLAGINVFSLAAIISKIAKIEIIHIDTYSQIIVFSIVFALHRNIFLLNNYYKKVFEKYKDHEPVDPLLGSFLSVVYWIATFLFFVLIELKN